MTSQSVSFLIISESFAGAIKEIIDFFKNEKNTRINIAISIIEAILVIIIGISTMIYVETIIIRLCGLEENVKDVVNGRIKLENLENEENDEHDNAHSFLNPIN